MAGRKEKNTWLTELSRGFLTNQCNIYYFCNDNLLHFYFKLSNLYSIKSLAIAKPFNFLRSKYSCMLNFVLVNNFQEKFDHSNI